MIPFGKMVKIQEAENQIITDYSVYENYSCRSEEADPPAAIATLKIFFQVFVALATLGPGREIRRREHRELIRQVFSLPVR